VTRVLAYVPDLMDRSKVAAVAGDRVRFVASSADLVAGLMAEPAPGEGAIDLGVIDVSRPGVLEALRALPAVDSRPRVIGFGSHVDRALLDQARSAGCDEVLARSAFFGRLPELLA
jgi:DNA-binding NarL/FixJ family response regulator